MNPPLTIHTPSLSLNWPEPALGRVLSGNTPEQAFATLSRLFTLCGQGQRLAARLLLFGGTAQTVAPAQELIFETLRRLLCDGLPAFSNRAASPAEWQAMRQRQYAPLAQKLIFGQPADQWLQAGYDYWLNWLKQPQTELAGWFAALWALDLPALPMITEPDARLLRREAVEVSPLALEYPSLAPVGGHLAVARLLARCVTLARALTRPTVRWRVFQAQGWQVAVVETARGWLTHQVRWRDNGRVADYRVTPPTRHHAHPNGLIRQTLAAVAPADWSRQLLLIDPCVQVAFLCDKERACA